MRRKMTFLIINVLLITLTFAHSEGQIVVISELPQPLIDVHRDVEIRNGGVVFVNDTFTISANPNEEFAISEFWTGAQEFYIHERRSFYIQDDNRWDPVSFEEESMDGFDGYLISLPTPVTLGDGVNLRLKSSYLYVNRVSAKSNRYQARLPVYPALIYNISSVKAHITFPLDAEFYDVISDLNFTDLVSEDQWVLDHESVDVQPFSNLNVTLEYVPSPDEEYLVDCQNFNRHITIGRGVLTVEDSYDIINTGSLIPTFHMKLPSEATDFKGRDNVGPLEGFVMQFEEESDQLDAYIGFRYRLRTYDRLTFTLSYKVPSSSYISKDGGKSLLTYPSGEFPFYIREMRATVTVPDVETLPFDFGASLPSERRDIVAEFTPTMFTSDLRPYVILIVTIGALGSVYIFRRRKPVEELKPTVVESEGLTEYIAGQVRRVRLLRDLDGLDNDVDSGEIKREEYDQRAGEINRLLRELTDSMRRLGRRLLEEDPELVDRLRQVQSADTELERVSGDLRNLEVRLRARRVSRRDYERRKRDRLNRRRQAINRIEQAVRSLQENI